MTYKFELFFNYTKTAHKYKIIQTLSSANVIYKIRYMIMLFMVYLYWTSHFFYTKLTHLKQKLKNLKLDETCGSKLTSN